MTAATVAVYWEEPRRQQLDAVFVSARETEGETHLAFDRTIFYPRGGGQPADIGQVQVGGETVAIADCVKDRETGVIWHVVKDAAQLAGKLAQDMPASLVLDWPRRHRMMRTHTAMHLLCAAVNAPVTGGNMHELRGRIDFDCEQPLAKDQIESQMNEWVAANLTVSTRWVDEKELDDNPELVRTMSVSPPRGAGTVRLVQIAGVDLQACGGTHLSETGEIGPVKVVKIEKKGRINRRVAFQLVE